MRACMLALLSALVLPIAAQGATLDTFTVTGTGFSLFFQWPPSPVVSSFTSTDFTIPLVPFTLNGASLTAPNIDFFTNGNFVDAGANFGVFSTSPTNNIFSGPTSAPTFILQQGTTVNLYTHNCFASLRMQRSALPSALAFFQMPTFVCGEQGKLSITQSGLPPSPTPEPESLVLIATGMLAFFGIAARRMGLVRV